MKTNRYRPIMISDITNDMVGKTIVVSGWVQNIRDHGGVLFLDLRDTSGVLQTVSNDDSMFKGLAKESVIRLEGTLRKRSVDTINEKLKSGEVELLVSKLDMLGESLHELPFEIRESKSVSEEIRLKYRYLDMRNEKVKDNILLRSEILHYLRNKMYDLSFTEVQTPILTASSPEGARDFIVPSRKFKGKFYALPQAPQIFKQLLMCSGFDRYFQIAPCFRDEDPRADRAPGEFYQIDFEMSFATQEDVFKVLEELFTSTFKHFTNWKVDEGPFIRIPYKEAMEKYGSDKPDLRNPLIIQDVTEIFKNTEFNGFKDKTIKAIVVPKGAEQGRKFFDNMTTFAIEQLEAKGLAWVKFDNENNISGGIAKFITEDVKEGLIKIGVKPNDSVFFLADEFEKVQKIAGGLRIELGDRLDLLEKNTYRFCLIVDFPMYELSDEGTIDFNHNPFSMPQGGMEALLNKDPLEILAYQYDVVCNGYEVASGAVRNHNPEIMVKAFEIAGYPEEEVEKRFGALYKAFQYGTPPHAGAAPGFDRIVMLIADEPNIREVIAFPKNKKARDALMGAPSIVKEQQLKDIHIQVCKNK